jgi:hypothetical protein
MRWFHDNGCPVRGDGRQANLEDHILDWLGQDDYHPAESTVRLHVARWIDEFRAGLG